MSERVLAGCSYGGDCPGVRVLASGVVAVTGALPDGSEVTVTIPAAVFDRAARILAFKRWRKPRRGIEAGVQLAIDLSLLGIDAARFDVRALPARDAAR